MNRIFFAFGLFAIAVILRYAPGPLGRFGFSIGRWAINFPLLAYWLLLATGSIIILVKVIGDIIHVVANARAHG